MKIFKCVCISIYVFFILIITFCLFGMTPFSSSKFGNMTITPLKNNLGDFKKGSLLFGNNVDVDKGDNIVYYDTVNGKNVLKITKVNKIMNTNKNITYVIDDGLFLSSDYTVGSANKIKSIYFLGYLYDFCTNSIVYFLTVILPIFVYFIYLFRMKKNA